MTHVNAIYIIIDEKMTSIMRCLDLFHGGKFLVSVLDVSFTTTSHVNDKYFIDIIYKSFEEFKKLPDSIRIAAIIWNKNIFKHESVECLSDGKYEIFINDTCGMVGTC